MPKKETAIYCIEGEYLTITQITQRLKVSKTLAQNRLIRARKRPGPVTRKALLIAGPKTAPIRIGHVRDVAPACHGAVEDATRTAESAAR